MTATEKRPAETAPAPYPWRRPAPAPPEAHDDTDLRGGHAGLISRVVASVLDALIVVLLVTSGWAVVAAARFLVRPTHFSLPSPGGEALLFIALGVLAAYLAVTWAVVGGTYGDRLLGLRVVDRHGTRLHWGRCLLRAVLCTLVPIGLFWVGVSRDNLSVQDLLLRTSVVRDS